MAKKALLEELLELSPAERVQLAEDLWDSVAATPGDVPVLTPTQRDEIDRRIAEHERDPSAARTWDGVRRRLWSRLE
jgi:putative addiction module component (TIGR02574 family)